MAWSQQQNPTGASNPAIRPINLDPADLTTTKQDSRAVIRARANRTVPSTAHDLPIAANAVKADGQGAPQATSAGQ